MIRNSKQTWQQGEVVRVGFLRLRVLDMLAVKDYLPDLYLLESLDGTKRYRFIPHYGVKRLTTGEDWTQAGDAIP